MKLPFFVQEEISQINSHYSPEKIDVGRLLSEQAAYNNRAVKLEGTVASVVSLDEMDEQTVSTWFLNLPTTVETTASATYFFLQSDMGGAILVKYPADLDVSAGDNVTLLGVFNAHGVTVQTRGLLRTKQEELMNPLGEPFVGAVLVENETRLKLDYIRHPGS